VDDSLAETRADAVSLDAHVSLLSIGRARSASPVGFYSMKGARRPGSMRTAHRWSPTNELCRRDGDGPQAGVVVRVGGTRLG
jgi:hypothetical protein